jgi:hypothetical protein
MSMTDQMKIIEENQVEISDLIEVKSAEYLGEYFIQIVFKDGFHRVVDFKSFLETAGHPSIQKYLDTRMFQEFKIIEGNLNWNDYDLIFPVYDLYRGQI